MTQLAESKELSPRIWIPQWSNTSVSVIQTGNTTLLEMVVDGISNLSVALSVVTHDLDAFVIQAKNHPNGDYITIASASGDFTAPRGRILRASGDLTVLAAAASGYVDMDVSGLFAVKILASGSNATPSVVNIYARGGAGGNSIGGLNSSEAHVGAVGGNKIVLSTAFTRESNATPYTAGDVVSAAAATVVPAIDFATAGRVVGGAGYVVGAKLIVNVKSVTPRFRVHLFNVNTATVSGDNLPWRELYADSSKRVGYFDLPSMVTGADTTNSDMSRSISFDFRLPYVCAAASQHLYAVLETLDAVTLTSGCAATLTLIFEQD